MLVVLGQDDDLKAGRAKERREGTDERNAGGRKCWKMKRSFVATKVCLPRKHFCCDKIMFVATHTTKLFVETIICRDKHDKIMFVETTICRDKHDKIMFVETTICRDKHFVETKLCLSRQAFFCRDKRRVLCLSRQTRICRNKTVVARKTILVAALANDSGVLGKDGNRRG